MANFGKNNMKRSYLSFLSILFSMFTFNNYASDKSVAYRIRGLEGSYKKWGTCVAIDKHSILTAYHVINHCEKIEIEYNGEWKSIEILKFDAEFDIALLVTEFDITHFAELDNRKEFNKNEHGNLYGSPNGEIIKEYNGNIINDGQINYMLDVKIEHGCSGGPIIGKNEKLLGICIAFSESTKNCMFLPTRRIKQFLDEK